MLSVDNLTETDVDDFVKWNCIHILSGKKYQDWVVQQSDTNNLKV